ncbi:carbohydrate kinase family protein [Falsiruegeria mediterranea]|uniref:Fructokinase n=1 Tax=Falsiruegeria mediterranea M17 TaxID=1200281 RepID=A0A2R8CG99_9RHOB|nr:carbohydrate kinase [Falsiruegeria mediterranea]SPJ31451.1 Fructokinase [Falsiruegeria mediterranea M17]
MILCCGEALIDMIPELTLQKTEGFVPHCGGAVMNTAVALGRLGVPTGLFTGLSDDMFGQQLVAHLHASNVDLSFAVTSSRPSTLAFVQFVEGQANYSFLDENSAGRMLGLSDLPKVPEDVSVLFFGGISLATEPGAETYATLLDRERRERVVMLDPNIRPQFIPDQKRYRARLERMLARTDILKVSDEDLDWMIPQPLPYAEKIAVLMKRGPNIVVMTRGSAGVVGFLPDGSEVNVMAERVAVVDTVGAGDTFNAGLLCKLDELDCLDIQTLRKLDSDALKQALAFASKVAAISVSRPGADPPWAVDVMD